MSSKYESEKENLIDLIINQGLSYEEIGRRYECTGSNIKKVAQRLGIELPQRRKVNENETFQRKKKDPIFCQNCGKELLNYSSGQKKYCSSICQQEFQSKEIYKYFLTSPDELQRANFHLKTIKKFILKEQENKCIICGNTNNLVTHHIMSAKRYPDLENDVDNGITLCEECHKKYHRQPMTVPYLKNNRSYQVPLTKVPDNH